MLTVLTTCDRSKSSSLIPPQSKWLSDWCSKELSDLITREEDLDDKSKLQVQATKPTKDV